MASIEQNKKKEHLENFLKELGVTSSHTSTGGGGCHQVRVRIHGMIARIEILPEEFSKLIADENRNRIIKAFKEYGFTYVTMDLTGYRTGSMNETLN